MKAILAGLAAAVAIGGAAMAQVDPDQSFTPGPPPSDQTPIPPPPNGDGEGFNQPPSNNSAEPTGATEALLFDNWNTGGCGLTDTATLDLAAPTHLARVSLWYNWQAGERGVNYSVSSGRRQVGGGTLTRGSCDPYQSAWCEARD